MSTSTIISFGVFDTTAKEDVTTTAQNMQAFSDLRSITDEDTTKALYGTLEPTQCVLNGSLSDFPKAPEAEKLGIWSSLQSNANGEFSSPIEVSFSFSHEHTSSGLTLWTNAKKIRIRWHTSLMILAKEYILTSEHFTLENTVENYTKIEITIYSTQTPNRYLRLKGIGFGVGYEISGAEIVSCKITEDIDITSEAISENICDFSFYDEKGRFNIMNKQGAFPALQESQKIKLQAIINGNITEMGTFYLNSWESKSDKILSCKSADVISRLDKIECLGDFYDTTASELIYTLLPYPYIIDESLVSKSVRGYLPLCSAREALKQIAFSIGAMVDCSRGDMIRIYPFSVLPTKYIRSNKKLIGGTLKANPQNTKLSISLVKFVEAKERTEIFSDTLNGSITIEFNEPVKDLQITGGIISESNVNHVVITGNNQEVILTGVEYKRQILNKAYNFPIKANLTEATLKVENAYLLNISNADEIAKNIITYYQNEVTHNFSMVFDNTKVGDTIMCDVQGKVFKGFVKRQNIDLARGMTVKLEMLGTAIDVSANIAFTGEIFASEWGIL